MRDYSVLLPISAAIIHGTGFILYNIQTKLGQSKPNPVSWFLWAFLATLNAVSFSEMNNPLAALQFMAGSVGCIMTFLYVLAIGKLARPSKTQVMMLVVGLLGIWIWKTSGLKIAYPIFVSVLVWSFVPTVWSVWKNPMHEKPTAWWFWTTAFTLTSIYTFFWKGGWTISMVVPLAGVIMHGIVPLISTESRKDVWLGNKYFELTAIQRRISEISAKIFSYADETDALSELEEDKGAVAWVIRKSERWAVVGRARVELTTLQDKEINLKNELGIT